jgi:hypothetical protein
MSLAATGSRALAPQVCAQHLQGWGARVHQVPRHLHHALGPWVATKVQEGQRGQHGPTWPSPRPPSMHAALQNTQGKGVQEVAGKKEGLQPGQTTQGAAGAVALPTCAAQGRQTVEGQVCTSKHKEAAKHTQRDTCTMGT